MTSTGFGWNDLDRIIKWEEGGGERREAGQGSIWLCQGFSEARVGRTS
jgi:hypothetical protein